MTKINSNTISDESKLSAYISKFPQPSGFSRRLIISRGNVYTEEMVVEEFFINKKCRKKIIKLGRVNTGFTFFNDPSYSTRLITKRGRIQAIELYIHDRDKVKPLELEIPLIYEDRLSKPVSPEALLNAFHNHDLNLRKNNM